MSDTEFLECNSYPDQLYSIDASDLNSEGIAEKKINGKCIGDIDIYNDAYNEVLLYFQFLRHNYQDLKRAFLIYQ